MRLLFFVLCILLLAPVVSAIPTTGAATNIGNNNFTLSCAGASGDTFAKWGTHAVNSKVWTANATAAGGAASFDVFGAPIAPSTTYYAACCDSSGCDSTPISFTTSAYTPLATSTLGNAIDNMTRSRFNILYIPEHILTPYAWVFPEDERVMGLTVVFGVMFFFVYVGLWLRTRSVATGIVMGLLTASFVLFANEGLNLGIPVEFQAVAQGLLYASMAGVFLAFLKK